MQQQGSDCAYLKIADVLAGYFQGGADSVNFEHIYHCAHELLSTFEPTAGTVNEFHPILQPFISRRIAFDEPALRALVNRMAEFIFAELSAVCETPAASLDPLAAFLAKLRVDHITRIYTTNYDDFLLQAAPDLCTGFDPAPSPSAKGFDGGVFWQEADSDGVYHLHGSVHLAFGSLLAPDADLSALHWFDDRATALRHPSYTASGNRRMDGSQTCARR